MIIIPDKKKMATQIVTAHMGDAPPDEEDGGDSYEALATEIIKAVKSGSAAALADALKAFHQECEVGGETE